MKRLRPVNSCLPCRKRRVRCDKIHPICRRCAQSQVTCTYDASASSDEPLPTRRSPSPGGEIAVDGSLIPGPSLRSTPRRNGDDAGRVYKQPGGRSSYVGATHWANAIPQEYHHEDHRFGNSTPYQTELFTRWHRPDKHDKAYSALALGNPQCKYCGNRYQLSCLVYFLPSQEICQRLCDRFFHTVFPLIPILHIPTFEEDFREFWRQRDTQAQHPAEPPRILRSKPGFVSLLAAMLFSSLVSASETQLREMLGENSSVQIGDLYFVTVMATSLTGFPRQPTLYALAAYIYAQSQFVREEEFSDGPEFINTAFRVALGMGLHRNLIEAGFTVAEQEMRKRLWWYILHLDVMSSCSSGLSPLFVDDKMGNSNPISLSDKLGANENAGKPSDIRYLVAATRYDTTKTIRGILIGHFEDKYTSSARVDDAAKVLDALSKRINKAASRVLAVGSRLPKQQLQDIYRAGSIGAGDATATAAVTALSFDSSWDAEAGQKQSEIVAFAAWAASLLHLMLHKAYCVLYYPLARDATSQLGNDIRQIAVKHAQAFLQLFIRVCDAPFSRPFHWMYPGTYQPLQPMSLLLADLLSFPHSDEASASQGLVDAIFELYQIDQGMMTGIDGPRRKLSPSGQQAWSMLGRVRRKALEQMDQDPHVVFPSSLATSNTCICGEVLVHACLVEENDKEEEVVPVEPPAVEPESDLAMRLETPPVEPEEVRFDWEDWDAFLGNSAGAMI